MALTYAELFAGAGGMSLGLEAGGFHAAAHAEIEPHARAVLRHRWPDTRLDGDVTQVNGADYAGITLLSGGSPCQDLSVAGKRAGLTGSRSSLFHEQVRIWHESGAPYLLWENVAGALSSNHGKDFATVLSTIVGSTVAVPADGWRGGGGVVAGRDAVAAFRVLDLQHFGPPQRRVRIFVLAARAGGVDPAEVLAVHPCSERHFAESPRQRERLASRAGSGAQSVLMAFDSYNQAASHVTATLSHGESGSPIAFDTTQITSPQTPISGEVAPAIGRTTNGMGVLAFAVRTANTSANGWGVSEEVAHTLDLANGQSVCVTKASEDGTGRETPIVSVFVDPGMESWKAASVIEPMCARDYKDAAALILPDVGGTLDFGGHGGSYNGQDAYQGRIRAEAGRPRRLTPLECERLMSWPDQWTATGRKDDGTTYALSDTARYRLCGNGVGSVCAEWIAKRLHDAIQRQEEA